MLDINDFKKTGEYRNVKSGEYFISLLFGEPMLCTIPDDEDKPRYILKPKEKGMRTKQEILEDGIVTPRLELEVLIDIRDIFAKLLSETEDISFNIRNHLIGDKDV